MFEWVTNAINTIVETITGGTSSTRDTPNPCDVGDCLDALATLESRRRDVQKACLLFRMGLVPLRVGLGLLSHAVLILVVAAVLGGPMGLIIAAAVLLGVVVLVYAWIPVVSELSQVLGQAYEAESLAIGNVIGSCPEACRGDVQATPCDAITDLPETPFDFLLNRGRLGV